MYLNLRHISQEGDAQTSPSLFSGGKDSTYMLLEMIRRNMRIDAVVFADTTMEFPPMYEHIDRVEQFLKAERGIPVTRLRAEYSFEQFMFDTMKGNTEYSTPGYGWPNISVRWCTWALKVQMIQAFSRALDVKPYHYIGFAADETKRLQRKKINILRNAIRWLSGE